jgi:ribosomal-protein-alanine N-acetyltransferase
MMALQRESPTAADWSQPQYEALFVNASRGPHSERWAWMAEDGEEDDGQALPLLGFLVAQRIDSEWELENIVVAQTARRRGVGTRLLKELIAEARVQQGNGIFLEVRESNKTARALYRKSGFEETGLRKSYYSNPLEDAILCNLSLY